jgi:hypothetical protein
VVRTHYRPPSTSPTVTVRGPISAAFAVALVLAAGCAVDVEAPAPELDRSRAAVEVDDGPTPRPEVGPAEVAGLREVLDELGAAFRAGDPDAVVAHVADPDGELAERWRDRAENLVDVPLSTYELEHDDTVPNLATDQLRAEHGDEVQVVRVRERVELGEFDADGAGIHDLYLTLVPDGDGGWLVVSDRDAEPFGLVSTRHLWDEGPVTTTQDGAFLAIHSPDRATIIPELLNEANAALDDVRTRWSVEWSERVPIIVPRDQDELARLINVTFDLSNFVAFATATVDGELGSYELTGSRIVVNPDRFLDRDSAMRQRILAHELLHVATRPAAGPFTPAWVEEGVAQRLGEGAMPGEGAQLRAAITRGDVREMPLDAEFTTGGRDRILLSYQASYSFFEYLAERFGEDTVASFYAEVGTGSIGEPGRPPHHVDRAARSAFGEDIATLREEWARALRGD